MLKIQVKIHPPHRIGLDFPVICVHSDSLFTICESPSAQSTRGLFGSVLVLVALGL